MICFQLQILGYLVFPHMVRDLVAIGGDGGDRFWIELANPSRREHRCLDVMGIEQLNQAPDPNPAAEFALGQLHRWFLQEPAQ